MTYEQAITAERAQEALDRANEAVNTHKSAQEQFDCARALEWALSTYEAIHEKPFTNQQKEI